jgi:glycosyltransferase involved in cell wall biosynthesis
MISFIVPAHNEERWIGKSLGSIRATMERVAEPYEVIVVDDASTDSTHQIAQEMGARTLRVEHRKISAVRNAGAREARSEVFFFVDADTQVNERAVIAALAALRARPWVAGVFLISMARCHLGGGSFISWRAWRDGLSDGREAVSCFARGKLTARRADFRRVCMRVKTSRSCRR